MNTIVKDVLDPVLVDGKINIPKKLDRVLIDIGTSYNAPHCQVWTQETEDVCVFGFEPNPSNIQCIKAGKWIKSNFVKILASINPNYFLFDYKITF